MFELNGVKLMPKESVNTPSSTVPDQTCADAAKVARYDVGYGKPPKATQFTKGRSGNPRGSKKKKTVDDFRIVIENVLEEPVKLRDGDHKRTVSTLEAMLRAQRRDALKGDTKAAKAWFKLAQKTGLFTHASPKGLIVIGPAGDAEQQMIVKAFHAELANPTTKVPRN
jgi:hypothetical protein